MKFEIDREELLKPLQAVIGVVERRQTLPVLANVLVVAEGGVIALTATDLEVELAARVEAKVLEPGRATLPARKLMDIVRNLPTAVRIQVTVDQDRAQIIAARSRFTLSTLPANDFPVVDAISDGQSLTLPQVQLRTLIDKTHFSMALQDVRYYLNGLLLELEKGIVRAVATDGHRLALSEAEVANAIEGQRQVIVPRKGIQELLRLLSDNDDPVQLELGANHIRVSLADTRFTSKLIDGRFPDYQRVIPAAADKVMEVDRENLRQALVRVSILSNEKYRGVRFNISQHELKIQSNNPEQEEAEEELAAQFDGQPIEIGFNASYLVEAISAVDEEVVEMVFVDANSSCLIRGKGNQTCKYVVMPMRL